MIGILGGTFDPVHYGHLRAALEVRDIFDLTEVRLIPSATPPHRAKPSASPLMRSQMLALAIVNHPELQLDSRELARPGASYMVDTLQSLRRDFPNIALILFIGTDAYNHLTGWHCWQQLFEYAHLVVMTRPGSTIQKRNVFLNERLCKEKQELTQAIAGKLFFQPVTQLDISATAIRSMIAKKQNPGFLLPDTVIEYIKRHQLYQTP